ncbi:MAG: cytochrome o ubiquinol oxidase subunit I [Chlamydiae bacterium]|nr:MAG: cytochrome o ubiquinol oxidase subunit I [Chlamydiota bacterium]
MFGKLTWDAFRQDPIEIAAGISMILSAMIIIGLLFYFKRFKWLWTQYLTSLDPKKIGMMYIVVSLVMLFKAIFDAGMIRAQQMLSVGDAHGYLSSPHFQQVFTAHGTTMIFFVGMGLLFGIMNLIIPLQIGARDVAFPFLNSLSFYLFSAGAGLLLLSLIIGKFSGTGWVAYPPLSGLKYNSGVGVDYWIWSVQIAGIGSLLSGINFLVTILEMRCPGMALMQMPLFVWSALCTMVLVIFAFPILTATIGMLSLDRLLHMHFFTADFGGNPMMYINLIWAWGHPEVYILILPAFGIFSEVVATFSQKRLFGYDSMVWALVAITLLSFLVWLHHFFTMGAGANVNAFFGIMTMLIAIPTGVKIFNWVFTMFRGRVRFTTPMLWFLGFVFIFTTGGMTGVLLSAAPVDFQVHNSLFLIAHFHSMVIGGVLFGFLAGITYWFPKFMGFKLHEGLGKYAFWCWFMGFLLAFVPLYVLGLMGASRRLDHYEASTGWQPLFIVAAIGAAIIICGIGFQILQILVSIKQRKENRDLTGDPWNGRTLEWSTSSPPPFYNFAILPEVHERDSFWTKKHTKVAEKLHYKDIHMPKNTSMGLCIGGFGFILGFALIWHIIWLGIMGLIGVIACIVIRMSDDDTDYYVLATEIEEIEARCKNL